MGSGVGGGFEGPCVAGVAVAEVFFVAEFKKTISADPGLKVGGSLKDEDGIIGTEASLCDESEIVLWTDEIVNVVE